ncbi:fungal specific transcription factor factor [Fusarium denticulatum]|uniref:Fungal specific transcription factor factor n=1 Tax=Fusarium denticulatum TaxID=48507 RepID=A0A8H5TMR4_9HYPO|nr:fungal specific transcription factor factor [Fusarium denticulatum]
MGNLRVCIVGGGLAGSLLANGLINNGIDTIVFERDEESLKREGYQIRLGDPALMGLASCLTDSQLESIVQRLGRYSGSSKTAPSICNTKFQTILDLSALPTYSKSSAINRVVLRDLLLDPVIAEGKVKFGKQFSHYEIIEDGPGGSEKVRVNFTDGSSDYCDILVAADGSGSKINKQIGAKNLVGMKSHLAFLSKGNATKARLRQLPPRLLNGPVLVFKNGISLYYALYLPASQQGGGDQQNDKDFNFDENQASFYWSLSVPREMCPFDDPKDIPGRRQFCLDIVRDWAPEYHVMLSAEASDEDNITVTMLRANTRGMGGNQAMRDAADMLPELLELNRAAQAGPPLSTKEIETRCNAYEEKMIDRSFAWVAKSGGTALPTVDLDGLLGSVISFLAGLLLPVATVLYKAVKKSEK